MFNYEIFSYENIIHVLLAVLAVVGVIALIYLIRLLHSTRKTMDSANTMVKEAETTIKEVRETTVPIIEKANVSVDAVNAELLRLDALIGAVEEAGTKAISTVGAATELAQKPVDLLNNVTDKLRRGWKERKAESDDAKAAAAKAGASGAGAGAGAASGPAEPIGPVDASDYLS